VSAGASIDGREVVPRPGETILGAARRLGIDVPAVCFQEGHAPDGGCRVCLVETGRGGLVAACAAPLEPGMSVRTSTPRLEALRRDVLALMCSELPAGTLEPRRDGTPFERLLARLGVRGDGFGRHGAAAGVDATHAYLRFDRGRCITCRRCLSVCEDGPGNFVFGMEGRGAATRLIYGPSERFVESPCTACGACVDACPTGALGDRDREGGAAAAAVESVCGYCGVGCRVRVETAGGAVLRIGGVEAAAVNRGALCVKGRYAHAWQRAPDRLTAPLLRGDDGALRPVSWERAVAWLAERLSAIRDRHGPDALGVMTSSRSTNEAAYLLQKLFRTAIGTNNVDCCARVCHSSTALALQMTTGTGAATASYGDIERAACIVVAGANPTEAHPVLGARIRQAALRGVPLVVIDPRRIELAECAREHLQLRPGSNVALFNALAKVLVESGRIDREYLRDRAEGFAELASFLSCQGLDEAARLTGIGEASVRRAAAILGAGPALFVTGLGLSETVQGTASVIALCNVAILTGSIGRAGAGMLPLRGQNNVQGNADMGSMPDMITGYQPVADAKARRRAEGVWGAAPPARPGLTIPEMIAAAAKGLLRALWIQGEDIAQSDPHQSRVLEALSTLELLVVQELFPSETARFAHLVLPAAGVLEQDGTFTSGERRMQRVRAAVAPPGAARPDWAAVCDVARAMGLAWSYAGPGEVMDEIARVAPHLFGGVSLERLEPDGLQWPCPAPGHPGTAIVHADGFVRGRGRLMAVDYAPSPEQEVAGYPYLLITGRVLDHYNVGTMTRRTPSVELVARDVLEIHPADAARDGVTDGGRVLVESTWGAAEVAARHSRRVAPGTLFLSFHFPETGTNRLVGPHLDPLSKCPEYKLTAVRIAPR
jgi:formate dehydrogenase alpha subunit